MRPQRLSESDIASAMSTVPDWTRDGDSITKTFAFPDFVRAFAWMTAVAIRAEAANHHPDWRNVYQRIEVTLSTHDVGGLTELDFALAKEMDALAQT